MIPKCYNSQIRVSFPFYNKTQIFKRKLKKNRKILKEKKTEKTKKIKRKTKNA